MSRCFHPVSEQEGPAGRGSGRGPQEWATGSERQAPSSLVTLAAGRSMWELPRYYGNTPCSQGTRSFLPGPAVQGWWPAEPVGPVGVHCLPLEWVFLVLRICLRTSGFPAVLRGSTHLALSVHGPEEEGQRPAPYLPRLLKSRGRPRAVAHYSLDLPGVSWTHVLWCTLASVALPPGRWSQVPTSGPEGTRWWESPPREARVPSGPEATCAVSRTNGP